MIEFPDSPHAIIKIDRPGFTDGQSTIVYDSWDQTELIKSLDIELVTNESSQAELRLFDPEFRVIDTFSDATAKAVVKAYLGYGPNLGEPIFKGVLAEIERGRSETTFRSFDMAFPMKLIKKAGYKNKSDDLAIIRSLVERNNLRFEGPESPLKLEPHKVMTQDEKTDWDWMMERARDAGYVVFVRQDTVFVKVPAKVGKPALTLVNGKDFRILNGFDLKYRTPQNVDGKPKVVTHRRRGNTGKRVQGESNQTAKAEVSQLKLKQDLPAPSKSKLSKRAQAQKDLEREHAFEANIETLLPIKERLDVRNTIRLQQMGKLFSGDYIVNTARYNFAPGKLAMSLELYRDIDI